MANEFHRLAPPPSGGAYVRSAWSGAIPQAGVLDWMNNDPATPLVQAPADGALANPANPYLGTYFVGGKEDAADIYANRAHRALAEGLDLTDNAIHRAIPFLGVVLWNVTVPTDTYAFLAATPVYMGGLDATIRLVRADDYSQVMDSVGNAIHVLLNTSDPLDAANFATNTVVQFTEALPVGQYYVVYGAKNCVAEVPELFTSGLHGYVEISAKVERMFQMLHAPIGGPVAELWDSPWDTTIYDLALSGLNERYRRARQSDWVMGVGSDYAVVSAIDLGWPGTNQWDAPGSGAWILRRGMAPTVLSKRATATPLETDKLNACWRAVLADDYNTHGGSVGVAVQGARPILDDGHQLGPGFATNLIHRPVRMTTTAWYAANSATTVPDNSAAFVQYEVPGPGPQTELTCDLQALNAHFSKTDGPITTSAVTTGYDMLELSDPLGEFPPKFWLIHRLVNNTKCVLRQLNGDIAPVGEASGGYPGAPTVTNVNVTWHTILHATSDGAAERQLQVAIDNNQFWPGYAPLPSPGNYGTVFMAALPWLGVISNMSLNQFQQFDQGVVGIFGSVLGNPLAGASPAPGVYPLPHPDIALQVGARNPLTNAFGQNTPSPFFTVLSNGYTYIPKVFVGEIGMYNPGDPNATINCEAGFNAPWVWTDSMTATPTVDDGLRFNTDWGNLVRYVKLNKAMTEIEMSTAAVAHDTNIRLVGGLQSLSALGGLGYGYRECLKPRHSNSPSSYVHVNVDNVAVECEVDLTENTYVMIDEWDLAGNNATLTIKFLGQPLYDKYSSIVGKIFTLNVYFSPNLPAGTRTLNITFGEADAIVHVYANTGTIVSGYDSTTHRYNSHYIDIYGGFRTVLDGQRINLGVISKCSIQNLTQ